MKTQISKLLLVLLALTGLSHYAAPPAEALNSAPAASLVKSVLTAAAINHVAQISLTQQAVAVTATSGGVTIKQPIIDTYKACTNFYAVASNATCVWSISGISSKKLKVLRIKLCYTISTNSGAFPDKIFINKRSTLNTGGTSTTETSVPVSSSSGSSSAVIKSYTANPSSLGTLVGRVAAVGIYGNLSNPATPPSMAIYEAPLTGDALTLLNANELLELSWGGVTPGGGSPLISVDCDYTVE